MSQLHTQRSKRSLPNHHNVQYKPKHLQREVSQRKKRAAQKLVWSQPIGEKIKRQQQTQLKPLKDLQTIMKHFKYKLGHFEQQNQVQLQRTSNDKEIYKQKNYIPVFKKRDIDKDAYEVQKKIKTILSLPTINRIKQQAKQYRRKVETQSNYGLLIFKDMKKKEILDGYNKYIMGEVRRKQSKRVSRFLTEY